MRRRSRQQLQKHGNVRTLTAAVGVQFIQHEEFEVGSRGIGEHALHWSEHHVLQHHVIREQNMRRALNRLMADAHRRRFDAVLVWKIDRFGRSLKHLVNALAELDARGVAFISLRDSLDLSTPSGRLMFQIIGAMAEFERALIQERVRAGICQARCRGTRLGRPGGDLDHARVIELRAQGASMRAIARELKVGLGTVCRAVSGRPKSPCEAIAANA